MDMVWQCGGEREVQILKDISRCFRWGGGGVQGWHTSDEVGVRVVMVMWVCTRMTLTSSFCIASILFLACSTFAFLPVMVITSLSLFSLGRSILVSVSSRIFRMLAPPLPMMFLWNSLKMWTSAQKLLAT